MDNQGILEALLYTSGDEGLEQKQLLEILELNENELDQLIDTYQSPGLLSKIWYNICFNNEKDASSYIEQLIEQKSKMKLSQAAMETLSIIAYNQPLTRSDIEMIRGLIPMALLKHL